MSTLYPNGIDDNTTLPNPVGTDPLSSIPHSVLHTNQSDAIKAIETELGANPSGASPTVVVRLDSIDTGKENTGVAAGLVTALANTLGNSSTRNVGTTAGTVAAGDDTRVVAAGVAAAREGVDVLGSNSFALTFAGKRVQQRDADGAVTITGLTGLSAGAQVSLVIRNTTGADIPVSFVPSVHPLNDSPLTFSLPAGKQARLSFGSVGTSVSDVDYALGVES